MKGVVMFVAISLLLIGFIAAIEITGSTVENSTGLGNQNQVGLNDSDDEDDNESALETEEEDDDDEASVIKANRYFCGKSTLGECETDMDCVTAGCSSSVCQSKNEEQTVTTCEYKECYNAEAYKTNCLCIKNKCMWSRLTESQIRRIITARNKINATFKKSECIADCICTGSTMKCTLANGREMIITAGNSGNVIVQVKGENMTTRVVLYKSEGKVYGLFRDNETKIVRMLPDQVKERIRERIKARLQNENITLNEDGEYEYRAEKRARLFFVFPVRMMVRAEIDAETGEVIRIRERAWWGFLAKDETDETLLGGSCGTVTPGQNDACCQNKGFDVWNVEKNQCDFSE